tara:strand:- start:1 stop:954 length:954 start_codon:yes stop_codon:yes gene_type:complete
MKKYIDPVGGLLSGVCPPDDFPDAEYLPEGEYTVVLKLLRKIRRGEHYLFVGYVYVASVRSGGYEVGEWDGVVWKISITLTKHHYSRKCFVRMLQAVCPDVEDLYPEIPERYEMLLSDLLSGYLIDQTYTDRFIVRATCGPEGRYTNYSFHEYEDEEEYHPEEDEIREQEARAYKWAFDDIRRGAKREECRISEYLASGKSRNPLISRAKLRCGLDFLKKYNLGLPSGSPHIIKITSGSLANVAGCCRRASSMFAAAHDREVLRHNKRMGTDGADYASNQDKRRRLDAKERGIPFITLTEYTKTVLRPRLLELLDRG